jgi:tetratricopeptide (TPR) repeat protein
MFRVTSLTKMDDRQLNKWIKRLALLLVVGGVLFTAFYFFDRWRPASTPIVDQRLSALEQAVRDKPDDVASRGQLADTYVAKGRFQDAIAQYDQILAAGKAEERASFGRAGAYMGLGQLDMAAKDYQHVVDLASGTETAVSDPILQGAYYGLGEVAMKEGRPADAITSLEKALAIKRSDADALYLVGTAYAATNQTDKAEAALRAAVAFVPIGWVDPYVALGDTFTKAGKTNFAAWATAMADLASGKPDSAERSLKAIVETDAAVDAAIGLGLLYETKGDLTNATTWYGNALAKDPQNAAAKLGLGRVSNGGAASPLPALPTPGAPGGGDN